MTVSKTIITLGGKQLIIEMNDGSVGVNGTVKTFDIRRVDERTFSVLVGGIQSRVVIVPTRDGFTMLVNGKPVEAVVEDDRDRLLKKFASTGGGQARRTSVYAPMPALVVKVEVEVGQQVQTGDGLLVLEAMKMENEIKAHASGTVKEIHAKAGDAVEKGELLLLLE